MLRTKMMMLSCALALTTPVLAQTPPPMQDGPHESGKMMKHHGGGKMLEGMSADGRKIVAVAMIDREEKRKNHSDARKAARDKVRAAMLSDTYSAAALRAAFEEERKLAGDQQRDNHEHMISVMNKLSAADRKIFAESTAQIEHRAIMVRQRMNDGIRKQGAKPTN